MLCVVVFSLSRLSVDAASEKLQKAIELSALSSECRHLATLKVARAAIFYFSPGARYKWLSAKLVFLWAPDKNKTS